ncbi:MAG: hypothetical protein HY431_01925, partial [Candidatus Levybacteria bacterium]|nr:hypothetical protein [Candidatus Levybacteria bacterium]
MQTAPLISAEESTPPAEQTTTVTNTNPDVISASTDSSTTSTQQATQTTESNQVDSQDQDNDDEDMDLDGDEDYDADADDPNNAARLYREQLRQQIEQQVQQDLATANQSQGESGGSSQVGDTEVETGDATNTAGILTTGNNNLTASPTGTCCGGSASVVTSGNGTDSSNDGSATIVNNNNTIQDNNAVVNNSLKQDTTTGQNNANDNVGSSSISSGDANTTGTIITSVNTNVDGAMISEFTIDDDHIGDIVLDFAASCIAGCGGLLLAQNIGNGSDSDNNAALDITNNNDTFQNNDATIGNDLMLSSDSGNNSASRNTGGDSSIDTGDANVAANVLTFANNNLAGNVVYGVINIFGDLIGDIIFPESQLGAPCDGCANNIAAKNTGNGSGSDNEANVDLTNNENVFQNNDADIINNLVFDATTGGNQTNANTGGDASVQTGDASVDVNVLNVVNTNLIGGNMWLVFINEAGNWIGKLIGAPQGQNNFAGSAGTEFNVDQNGVITASNNGNGSGSDNTASASQTNNNNTKQNNNAEVINNLNLTANTGYNKANDNTGGNAMIKTGDAEIVANLVNFVNNNIVGNGKLFVTVVNVFGSWIGDFVAPGQHKQSKIENQQANNSEGNNNTGGSDEGSSSVTNNGSSKQKTSSSSHDDTDTDIRIETSGEGTTSLTSANGVLAASISEDTGNTGAQVLSMNTFAKDAQAKKVKINLAWVVLLVPLISLLIIGKKLFLGKMLPRIR